MSLRMRLVALLATVTCVVLLTQTLFWLSSEITDIDHRVETAATIQAQGLAAAAAALLPGDDPRRFDGLVDRARRALDLQEMAVTDATGRVIGHSDPSRVGEFIDPRRIGPFAAPRPRLMGLMGHELAYTAGAPVLAGTRVAGFVVLVFHSAEIADRTRRLLGTAVAVALLWLGVGTAAGTLYVNHITRPLASLTAAARSIGEGRLEEVQIAGTRGRDELSVLQRTFNHLIAALRTQRAENALLIDRVQDANEHLRQRVDEVTADLRQTAAYLEAVFHCIDDGILTCDAAATVVQVNEGGERHLDGVSRAEVGVPVDRVLPDGEALGDAVRAVMASGQARRLELTREIGGAERILSFEVYPLRDPAGAALGAVVVFRDVTAQRGAEVHLRRQDRLASLGTIAAGLGHELGNYLHAIGGFTSILLRKTPEDDPRRRDLQSIHDDNARAVALIERFLQFARVGKGRFAPAPLGTIVRDALDVAGLRLHAIQAEVVDALGDGGPELPCDARLLTQVFVNLVLNACDAMAGRPQRLLRATLHSGHELLQVSIEDTGAGIAPQHLERVFDPFFTTKGAQGTGLGLSIAHQIVESHGGALRVRSTQGQGTTFTVELPRSGPPGVFA